MKKWFKRGLFALVAFVIVALIGAAVFLLTFDPNAYKNKVEELVFSKYQRQLQINGDIELSLFPRIGLSVEQVTLTDRDSDTLFSSIDSARFAVAVWPLLWNKLVVDHVAFTGVKVWLTRDENGVFNMADLMHQAAATPTTPTASSLALISSAQAQTPTQSNLLNPDVNQAEFQIDIAGLSLKEGELHFVDKASDTHLRLVNLDLNTGRMTFGQPFDVIFKGQLKGEKPQSEAQLDGQAVVQLEPHLRRYAAQRMNLSLTGQVGDYKAQSATLRGGLEWLTHTEDLRARHLELLTQGTWQSKIGPEKTSFSFTAAQLNLKQDLRYLDAQKVQWRFQVASDKAVAAVEHKTEIALDIPRLQLEPEQVNSDPIAFSFKQTQGEKMFGLNARIKTLGGTAQHIDFKQLQLDLAGKAATQAWKLTSLADVQLIPEKTQLLWANLSTDVLLEDEGLNPNPAHATLTGAGQWDWAAKKGQFDGEWNSANTESQISSRWEKADEWLLDLQLAAKQIDLTPWLVTQTVRQARAVLPKEQLPNYLLSEMVDWRKLNTQLALQANSFNYNDISLTDVDLKAEQKAGKITLSQSQAKLFNGDLNATGSWSHQQGSSALKANLKDIDLFAMSQLLQTPLRLGGTGEVQIDLNTTGRTAEARRANLTGSVHTKAKEAVLVGWDAWAYLQEVNEAVRNVFSAQVDEPNGQFTAAKNSVLQQLDYQVQWQNGQGSVKKLHASSRGMRWRVEPHSYFDAVNQQMDVGLRLDIQPKTLPADYADLKAYATHPVYIRLSGPWSSPVFAIEWTRLQQPFILKAIDEGLLTVLKAPPISEVLQALPQANMPKTEDAPKGIGSTLKDLLSK